MWISYSDSEVNKFHPVCERALNRALLLLEKDSEYRVLHHQYTGSLEMDYVIQNIITGKYLCVVEVKRTPSDIHSARYQFQAMSYVQMNANESEKPFYILTNLEYAFAFRYDSNRPRVFQQMLKPGLSNIGSFIDDDEETFANKLAEYFKERINEYCNNSYEYLVTLEEFAEHMERLKGQPKRWKSHLAVLLYEYIRGAFTFLNRNDLPDIRVFNNNIARICNEAARVNFKDIFDYTEDKFENETNVDNSSLINLYDFGNQNVSGDSVSGILHQIVSAGHEHEGEVPTDLELGRIVAELAKYINGNLSADDLLCDPAAGSGNLVSAAVETLNLRPTQILVNDRNPRLLELLSLRLGLNFARTVSRDNSPKIHNSNIVDLENSFFENVKIIVMNPPFVAGINCVERKQEIYRKIYSLTGENSSTNIGQMPLEAPFLELITHLIRPGTTIACVFPKTHLMARGNEAQLIRRLILNNLGLRVVFTYPGNEIFDEVVKDTCVLVGKAMQPSDSIEVISSYEKIPDLDTHRFSQSLSNEFTVDFTSMMPGVVAKKVTIDELRNSITDGWRSLNSEMVDAISFVKANFETAPLMRTLGEYDFIVRPKRGNAGNNGGSDIMFFKSRQDLYSQFENRGIVLKAGMRNARLDTLDIGEGDSEFLDVTSNDEQIIDEIIDSYIQLPARGGRQQRQEKTHQEWKRILQRESRNGFSQNSVLVPRAIRTSGRAYLSTNQVFVSTNFVVYTMSTYEEALMLSTWMTTIFYQLICEVTSKDQEGMRKMEVADINTTFIPQLDMISLNTRNRINEIKDAIVFLNLKNPEIRDVDKIWAEELFGDEANEILETAQSLLSFLAHRRNS